MERLETVFEILAIQPLCSEKELNKRKSNLQDFQRFSFKAFSKRQLKEISKNKTKATLVNDLFGKYELPMHFDPIRLGSMLTLLNTPNLDVAIIHHLETFSLYQYIAFILQFEATFSIEYITVLFKSLIVFPNNQLQAIVSSAICDIFSIMMDNYSHGLFLTIFGPLSDFLMTHNDVDPNIYSFLPMLLKRVIDDSGYSQTSDAARLSSLLSLLLSEHSKSFSQTTIDFLFEVIRPYLSAVNEFALIIMQNMRPFLDHDQVNTFFLDLPSKLPQLIEENTEPFIKPPNPCEFETFSPSPSPECHFRFFEVESFNDGFDASSAPPLPSPSVVGLCNPKFYSLIDMIVKVINDGHEEAQLFLDALTDLVDVKSSTPYKYDYLGMMILYWIRITENLPICNIRFPQILFEPTISIFDETLENSQVFFSIRFYGLNSILKIADPPLDKILLSNVKYPKLLTELVELCNLNLDKISTLIMNKTWMIRTIRLIALQLQSAEFNKEISVPVIENARLSVFRLIFRIFIRTSFVYSFLSDVLFLSFFLSHLFEEKIRPFILSQLKIYISCELTTQQYDILLNQLCQVIEQIYNALPNKRGLNMISDILSTLTSKNIKPELLLDLCDVLHDSLQYFDESELSHSVILQILSFFTNISKSTQRLPNSSVKALEAPLKKFTNLTVQDFNACLCLLASENLNDFTPIFKIKNGDMLNIMFRVFFNNTEVDIVDTAYQLVCSSIQNCGICHKCHFDLALLDFLLENRDSDDPRISGILMILATIAGAISSPAVVQRFISLFIPVENRYSSKLHDKLLKPLLYILNRAQESPSLILPLNCKRILPIVSSKASLEKGMTFTFWIFYDSGEETHIFTLLNGDERPFFTLGMKKDVITIDGNSTSLNIPKKHWKFVAFSYQNGVATIFLDAEEVWKANLVIKFPIGVPSAKIGEKTNTRVQLGNFGLFDSFDSQFIKQIFNLGPRSVQIKHKPLFYFTQENMRTLTGYSINSENRTFTDVLFRFFKIEVLLPLFAQLDLPLKNGEKSKFSVLDVVSIFKAALFAGELEQYDFGQVNGFSIIAHLLCSSSPEQISFQLYSEFYNIMDTLVLKNVRNELFTQIIMNFDLWIVASPEDQKKILTHYKKVIFPKYQDLFIEFFPFSYLLDILRIYYWYDPIEKSKIRCEPGSSRPRNKDINVSECRSMTYSIMYDISEIKFRNEDFSALMEHITTLEDDKQQLDLLLFMNGLAMAPHYPLTNLSNTIPTLSRVSNLLHCQNDQVVTAVFNVIYSVHSKVNSSDLTLVQHIDAVMKDIEMRKLSYNMLDDLQKIMLCNTPLLFPLVTYIGYRLVTLKVFEQSQPSQSFVVSPYWALWAVAEAITLDDGQKKMEIFSYLVQCSTKQWQSLSDMIEIVTQALRIPCDSDKFYMLKVTCKLVLGSDTMLNSTETIQTLFGLLKQHIFYRRVKAKRFHPLEKLYETSPFYEEPEKRERRKSVRMRALHQIDILNLTLEQYDHAFGLRVDSNAKWRDEELAQLSLKLIMKLRMSQNEACNDLMGFGFVVAGFLMHSCPDFVNNWLAGMNLVKEDCDNHLIESQFLVAKASELKKEILIQTQLEDAFNGAMQVFESLPTKFFDTSIATSNLTTHRGMKTFSQQSANNLFLVQQQEIRNAEFENDINLATEVIRSHDERNSKFWYRIWSNVVVNGGPWDPAKLSGKRDKTRWKRDITFCKFYCPMKLKRNRKYTNHVESSIARDAGNAISATKMLEDYKQKLEEEYQKNAPPELLEIPTTVDIDEKKSEGDEGEQQRVSKKKKRSSYDCELIRMKGVKNGTFVIFSNAIHININATKKTYILPASSIEKILLRRRFHIKTAIEIFMVTGESYFVNFPQYRSQQIVQRLVFPETVYVQKEEPAAFLAASGITERWRKGLISNFEYLMSLNIISGRSFNDSSQYPFFPWVISDYTSETLDLNNPASFRDLSKPIGAIGDARFKDLTQRMKDMMMFNNSPYMYSSFAICPLSLYLWLFRMEPFTTLHIDMQSGKFDHPSRLFSSIPDSYNLVTQHMNDYRELIPEFYFLPDFLRNDNEYDLGKAKGVQVDDVILPKWAKSPEDCVYMFRKALESDIASSSINKWIDLVWGYKQRGENAKEANNLFMPDMYETAWTPQVMKDPRRRAEIEAAMCHVGQFPPQIFTTEHPAKILTKKPSPPVTIAQLPYTDIHIASLCYKNKLILSLASPHQLAQLSLSATAENNITIGSDLNSPVKNKIIAIETIKETGDVIGLLNNGTMIKWSPDGEKDYYHQELMRVSSITVSDNFFAAVSDDTTLNIIGKGNNFSIPFYGDSVTCCAISKPFKVAVCGTFSGNIVVCSIYEGRKINVIQLEQDMRPTKLMITSNWGFIVTYATKTTKSANSKDQHFMFVHSINGRLIRSTELSSPITTWCSISSNKAFDYIVASSEQGKLHLFEAFYLNIEDPFYRCYKPVVGLYYLKEAGVIVVVKNDGNVVFHPICVE
ncbi:hypothetical protein TRFO_26513 [Tritrichomonas foetus]|uniref:Beige/BEACH domain containing protein n=1 Tax=Tritrichomonas foetus TaxID=1144522 RepID=A0A1J4K369_9EUKA|nr:hypothetical protein TRFO_26513 [Tritrichomonas foetus]|eukprot:OHT05635.1 hypothetical protein TRFO_26513 [Tritrichomonas foetus]